MKPEIDVSVLLNFSFCSGLGTTPGEGGRQAMTFVRKVGGEFLRFRNPEGPDLEIDPNPAEHLDPDGNLINSLDYAHPLLARPLWEFESLKPFHASGRFGYIEENRTVSVIQTGDANDQTKFDALATGQLALARELYPLLRPRIGYVDVWGENKPADKLIRKTELRKLFWANFFGPDYAQALGRGFLLDAPGWKKEELCDGGILYVATESFQEWWKSPPTSVLEYFRTRIPRIKAYRAQVNWDA